MAARFGPKRRWLIAVPLLLLLIGLSMWGHGRMEELQTEQRMREFLERNKDNRVDDPTGGLGQAWADCLERLQAGEREGAQRIECNTVEGQGVTSTLVALRFEQDFVPVLESRMEDRAQDGRIIVDVVGGPGDSPFYSNPAVNAEIVEEFRGQDEISLVGVIMDEHPYYQLMLRGYTIASIAYSGTSVRTLDEPGEIVLAAREVGLVIDHYRDVLGEEPPLVTTSLGNHLALAALGQERLESMQVLSLVPVMDGLQHHLETARRNAEHDADDVLGGEYDWFNVYTRNGDDLSFDHRRMVDLRDFAPQFIGEADLAWRNLRPQAACSSVTLGDSDPRTAAYLAATENLPPHVRVWESDHDLFRGASDLSRQLFAEFADCLLAGRSEV